MTSTGATGVPKRAQQRHPGAAVEQLLDDRPDQGDRDEVRRRRPPGWSPTPPGSGPVRRPRRGRRGGGRRRRRCRRSPRGRGRARGATRRAAAMRRTPVSAGRARQAGGAQQGEIDDDPRDGRVVAIERVLRRPPPGRGSRSRARSGRRRSRPSRRFATTRTAAPSPPSPRGCGNRDGEPAVEPGAMELWQRLLVIGIVLALTAVAARLVDRRIGRRPLPGGMTRFASSAAGSPPSSSASSRRCS